MVLLMAHEATAAFQLTPVVRSRDVTDLAPSRKVSLTHSADRSASSIGAGARSDLVIFLALTGTNQRPVVASLSTVLGPSWKSKAFVTAVLAAFVAMLIAEAFKSKIEDRESSVRASNFNVAMALTVVFAGPIVGLVALLGVHIVTGFATWSRLYLPVNLVIASGVSGYVVYQNLIWIVRGVDPSGKNSDDSE